MQAGPRLTSSKSRASSRW